MALKSLDDIGQLVGLKPGEAVAIWEQEKANKAKLDGCTFHQFRFAEHEGLSPIQRTSKRFTCLHCQGTLQYGSILWYERGVYAASLGAPVFLDKD